jgi:LCP family protein required for cell wall assembly
VGRIIGLVAAAAVIAVGVTVLANRHPGDPVGVSITSTVANVLQGDKTENILLIGNNARDATTPTAAGEADLIYVVHFDPKKRMITVLSVPRDALVAFPDWNDPIPKIKSALLMGGAQLETQTVSKFLGMPIQGYIEADFSGFEAAINAVGGVEIDVPARLYDPTFSHANFYPGKQHMNGTEALAYVRIRQNQAGNGDRTNSFQRSDAGTQVMEALKEQVLAHTSVGALSRLVGVLRSDFATNLSTTQLVGLLASANHAKIETETVGRLQDTMVITSTSIPGVNHEGKITGAYYDVLTPQEIDAVVKPLGGKNPVTGLAPLPAPSTVTVTVSENADGQAVLSLLHTAGFKVSAGTVPDSTAGAPIIEYPAGQLAAAEAVGRAIGNTNEVLEQANVANILVETPS